ncbi:cercosporin toxin biosynthesis protein [Lineolata rhizophorae]|uniref:Cercosporin toxin biosynthesis protein n=1 Tax=Lineolata rhizophorae TaxID=578093 RepID=A0A6A6NRZ0_9PEZI|nr:cercosporin toxin biosynthesis protein [Lineolata rhizophorae]
MGPLSHPILIIGTGISGLALAQSLKKHHLPVRVFEKDSPQKPRLQGYRIRINGDGQRPLQACLPAPLWDLFLTTCHAATPSVLNYDALSGAEVGRMTGPPPGRPAHDVVPRVADRRVLRDVLLRGLSEEAGEVSYGRRFARYEVDEAAGVVRAFFADGSVEEGCLLVGADGVASAVRAQLAPGHVMIDTDARCVYGKTVLTPALSEAGFPREAAEMMAVAQDGSKGGDSPIMLFMDPVRFCREARETQDAVKIPEDYVYWVFGARTSLFGLSDEELHKMSNEECVKHTVELAKEWHPSMRALLELQDEEQASAIRISAAKPPLKAWEVSKWVTLIGDAVHAMPPTGGSGANTALRDAAGLSEVIVRDVEEGRVGDGRTDGWSLGMYEAKMREYGNEMIEMSFRGGKRLIGMPPTEECKRIEI